MIVAMDFDRLLIRFFGTDDISALPPDQLVAGTGRLRLQFGLERDPERRFTLWSLMYMLGVAPDLDATFQDKADRDAARDFMDMIDREIEDDA